jgi:hypothetical protein
MATTRVLSGSVLWEPKFRLAFGGDFGGGQETPTLRHLENWSHDGGAAPTLSGWLYGTLAVGLFNRGLAPSEVTVSWSQLGITGRRPVRDLWRRADLGRFAEKFTATVPRHGVVLLKIGKPK